MARRDRFSARIGEGSGFRGEAFVDEAFAEAERVNAEHFYRELMGLSRSPGLRAEAYEANGDGLPGAPAWAEDFMPPTPRPRPQGPTIVRAPLPARCHPTIIALADASPVVRYSWPPNRGTAPLAYLRGMALVYGRVYCKWKAGDEFALETAKAAGTDTDVDALAVYDADFRAASMSNATDGVDTLRHVFVLLIGLGMLESGGRYNTGRDLSASNTASTTAEAGLFQMSYSLGVGSRTIADGWLERLYRRLSFGRDSGLRSVFAEGRGTKTTGDFQNSGFGDDEGGRFRRFAIRQPALGAELAALGMRKRVRHWGPLRRGQVTINADVDALLSSVQTAIDRDGCCDVEPRTPGTDPPATPPQTP